MSAAKTWFKDITYGNKITVVLRIVLGAVFVLSSIGKIINPQDFSDIVRRYNIISELLVPYVAIVLPFVELLTGLLLVVGYKIKASALIVNVLLIAFIVFIIINMFRGETFECGCLDLEKFGIFLNKRKSENTFGMLESTFE